MFGNESFSPVSVIGGAARSLHDVAIQVPGSGHRVSAADLERALQACPKLRDLLVKCLYNITTQISYTSLANAVNSVDVRLARWLLMCHDRVSGDQMTLTHDYIALLLAVRRPSVTTSLHMLEGNAFIRSERKLITTRNRAAMEDFTRDAYGRPEQEWKDLFGFV
jgi:CRP-like cAMP-binding protein